jgi:hypothetical protein
VAEQQDLIARFRDAQADLLDALSGLDEQQAGEVWSGTWAVRDIVGHVVGWELSLSEVLQKISLGERPSVEGIDLNDTDGSNAIFAARASGRSFANLVADLRAAGEGVAIAIEGVPDDRIQAGRTARRIAETLITHPAEHTAEILAWRRSRGC